MRLKSKWLISILVVFILAACAASAIHHLRAVKDDVENTFISRNELVGKFVALQRDRVEIITNMLLAAYQSHALPSSSLFAIQQHSEQGFWQLKPANTIVGSVTGIGQKPLSPEIEHEINALLVLDTQIKSALELDKDMVRVYFLSASQFVYVAPATSAADFHFTPALYERAYWLDAGPAANKARRLIVSEPYEDEAGSGWIITFSQPVYADDQFLGIVGLDLRNRTLGQLIDVSTAPGESWLLGERGQVISRENEFRPGSIVRPPLSKELHDWRTDEFGDLWLSSPVLDDELWLTHRLTRSELYWAVARQSAGVWFLVVILSLLALLSLRLRKTLAEVTRLTRVDPLTQALNRRGFYEMATRIISIAQRKQLVLGVLMLDIDYFKKINDNFGHAEGDSVLKQVGDYVNKARRPSDIFCRWGGEEFLLLLLLDRAEDVVAVAERMRAEAQRTRIHTNDTHITLSGGLILMGANEPLEDAIKRADDLLYQSKQAGRNRITYEKNE